MDRVASYREIRVLAKGAEAELILAEWMGLSVIVKRRTPRGYLNPELDRIIRGKRTLREAQMLHEAKLAGIPTPVVYFVDPRGSEIIMQYVKGERLKEIIERLGAAAAKLVREAGRYLGLLHRAGIVHGDPTPANLILSDGVLVMIDFGLAYKSSSVEDYAVDMHLAKEVFRSYHSDVFDEIYKAFLDGYKAAAPRTNETLARLGKLELSGRYKQVV